MASTSKFTLPVTNLTVLIVCSARDTQELEKRCGSDGFGCAVEFGGIFNLEFVDSRGEPLTLCPDLVIATDDFAHMRAVEQKVNGQFDCPIVLCELRDEMPQEELRKEVQGAMFAGLDLRDHVVTVTVTKVERVPASRGGERLKKAVAPA